MIYERPIADKELAALGLSRCDFEHVEHLDIWPENFPAVRVFDAMGTQWRVGAAGAVGLDYNALPVTLRMCGVSRASWPDIFQCIRIMEHEALQAMREN